MSNIDTYEGNLPQRLEELRTGDPGQILHEAAIVEALVYSHEAHGYEHTPRVLDCGCGLGFLTSSLLMHNIDVTGIDPSQKSIEMAINEHGNNIPFYKSSAEEFPKIMKEEGIEPYDQAILNMVLHSVDDDTVMKILESLRECLKPEGTIIVIVPDDEWIVNKLIEYALDQEMDEEEEENWITEQLLKKEISLPYRINSGVYYPEPLTFYNRQLNYYAEMFRSAGYGVRMSRCLSETGEEIDSVVLPYDILGYYSANMSLWLGTSRILLMSYALID
jgi:SAM-dependent methyltransferase